MHASTLSVVTSRFYRHRQLNSQPVTPPSTKFKKWFDIRMQTTLLILLRTKRLVLVAQFPASRGSQTLQHPRPSQLPEMDSDDSEVVMGGPSTQGTQTSFGTEYHSIV
ncbi:hypothetical protein PROFUN_03329 [Planoprotostelium fungivorum]|uniref:Uncharacterized protein n=1 Tax=Planoprotostelium fungivorum TaxID=1890364 RepID=A0A2P6NWS2_9EUKA|nr:hypothetical protein PROFUN_03329 [Planoprotostelium fungivorum]